MTTIQKSMRLPEDTVEAIQDIAQQKGKDFSSVTKQLLDEAIRMHRCPGIAFSEGVNGRRARIAGTGIEVWEIIACFQSVEKDFARLQEAFHWLSELQLRAALSYYQMYSEEIDRLIAQNESWDQDRVSRRLPFLSVKGT
jgi:uncharacterized protein (DUF433 family)